MHHGPPPPAPCSQRRLPAETPSNTTHNVPIAASVQPANCCHAMKPTYGHTDTSPSTQTHHTLTYKASELRTHSLSHGARKRRSDPHSPVSMRPCLPMLWCVSQPTRGIRSDSGPTPIPQIHSGTIQRTEHLNKKTFPRESPQVALPYSWILANAAERIHSSKRDDMNYDSVSNNRSFPPQASHSSTGTGRGKSSKSHLRKAQDRRSAPDDRKGMHSRTTGHLHA